MVNQASDRSGAVCQFGRTSAPRFQQPLQTNRGLELGEPDVIRPWICADRDRCARWCQVVGPDHLIRDELTRRPSKAAAAAPAGGRRGGR
jgi:hypothetical protein